MSKLTIAEVNAKIEKHEAVCAERWLEVLHRVTRLEQFILITWECESPPAYATSCATCWSIITNPDDISVIKYLDILDISAKKIV